MKLRGRAPALAMLLGLVLSVGGVAMAAVSPVLDEEFQAGNAETECAQVGDYEYAYQISPWSGNGVYPTGQGDGNVITISNNDGTYFDWSADNPIDAVIVKGGEDANVFYYPPASSDTDLYAPDNASGGPAGLSHVTFCWNEEEPDDPRIIVEKVAANAPEGYEFEFDPSWGPNFFLAHGESEDSGPLEPGIYSVSEIVPEGFVLGGAVCDDGSLPSAIDLEAGETVTCTFTNRMIPQEEYGNIIVVKETLPAGSEMDFEFASSWEMNFLLSDGESRDSGPVSPGIYSVSEIVPEGWLLESAVCDDGSDPSSIEVSADETVTCTFTNSEEQVLGPEGSLTIIKLTNPAGGEGFAFTTSENLGGPFALDDGGSVLFSELESGAYTVTEAEPGADWAFQSVQCQALDWSFEGRSVTVNLAEGEAAVCTFYNIAELPFTGSPSWLLPLLGAGLGAVLLGTGMVAVPAVRRIRKR